MSVKKIHQFRNYSELFLKSLFNIIKMRKKNLSSIELQDICILMETAQLFIEKFLLKTLKV